MSQRSISPVSVETVVFPLVPVMPMIGAGTGAEKETHLHLDRDAVRARQLQQRRAPRHARIADDQVGPVAG